MPTLLIVLAIVVGIAMLIRRRRGVVVEQPGELFPGTFEPSITTVPSDSPAFAIGTSLHHIESGLKVEIIKLPSGSSSEYEIRWPEGEVGYIHEEQLKEWFTQ